VYMTATRSLFTRSAAVFKTIELIVLLYSIDPMLVSSQQLMSSESSDCFKIKKKKMETKLEHLFSSYANYFFIFLAVIYSDLITVLI
jgi:hypothetical protein